MGRRALFALWPLLLAASAPVPSGFVAGITRITQEPDNAVADIRAAGFNAVRVFLGWSQIETVEGVPDWTCRYLTASDVGPDTDQNGTPDPWPDIPCDGTPCGCGYSADERLARAAEAPQGLPILLTIVGTPEWARGARGAHCPADSRRRVLPLRRGKESAFRDFVGAAARRYGGLAYAFELWSEPDLPECIGWGGTRQQYKEQILSAATAVKDAGAVPGLVVAPSLEDASGDAIDAWMDWSQPVDLLSFNIYTTDTGEALAKIEEMNAWCRAGQHCPGFYVTEFGARRAGPSNCPGPRTDNPGAADVAVMKACRSRRWCAGIFLYPLSERTVHPECGRGLLNARGCRRRRLCTIARRFFEVPTLPFSCRGCGP